MRVLVIGGYGGFGGLLSRRLAGQGMDVIVAGRRISAATAFCRDVPGSRPAAVDRRALGPLLAAERPQLVIDASGPFQSANYRVVEQCLDAGCSYLDLADARAFVSGIYRFDAAARQAGVAVIAGASSVPALSGAAVRELARGLDRVTAVEIAISASRKASAGRSVATAILGGVGQPIRLWRGGRWLTAFGWQELRRERFELATGPSLGRLPVALADVPDIEMLPDRLPGRPAVTFRAGTVSWLEVLSLWLLSWPVRWGWLRSLQPLSRALIPVHGLLSRFGGDRSAMVVRLFGTAGRRRVERRWTLVAEAGDGPKIPTLAAALLAEQIRTRTVPLGARDAGELLSIADFTPALAELAVSHALTERVLPDALYHRALNQRFDALPPAVRAIHHVLREGGAHGRATVERGSNPLAQLAAALMRFPPVGDYELHVHFEERDGTERWTRDFGGHRFSSVLALWSGGVTERFGPLRFAFTLESDQTGLRMHLRRWSAFGVRLPLWLAPRSPAREWEEDGRFQFDVPIDLPLIGRVIRYRGWLQAAAA